MYVVTDSMVKVSVKRIVIEVPEGLRVPPGELEERLRVEPALRLYEKGIASLGQARRTVGLSKRDFLELLSREGIRIHYGEEELRGNLETVYRHVGT